MARPGEVTHPWGRKAPPWGLVRFTPPHTWRLAFRLSIVLLPALVVFGVEVVRHEVLHGLVPEMLGNALIAALCISALILVPIYRRLEAADAQLRATELQQAVSQERERLARELHDGISQALFSLNVKATALGRVLGSADAIGARTLAILALISRGLADKEIAATVDIVEGTVKRHLQNILAKLHLRNRVELATFAVVQALIRSGEGPSSPTMGS
jgi:signal transduction histidine kinase